MRGIMWQEFTLLFKTGHRDVTHTLIICKFHLLVNRRVEVSFPGGQNSSGKPMGIDEDPRRWDGTLFIGAFPCYSADFDFLILWVDPRRGSPRRIHHTEIRRRELSSDLYHWPKKKGKKNHTWPVIEPARALPPHSPDIHTFPLWITCCLLPNLLSYPAWLSDYITCSLEIIMDSGRQRTFSSLLSVSAGQRSNQDLMGFHRYLEITDCCVPSMRIQLRSSDGLPHFSLIILQS
jgi:hypothetical protein